MNDVLARSGLPPPAPESVAAAASPELWLPAQALNCYEGDARLRSWLTEPGLLTSRMRDLAGEAFRLRVIHERSDASGHLREIELLCGERAWLYARTWVPAETLKGHPWLAQLRETALGEVLAGRSDVVREPFEFSLAAVDSPVIVRALERAATAPQSLWIRRSRYAVSGAPFVLQEVFFPGTGVLD